MLVDAPLRKTDRHGSGAFEAPRGNHKHRGIDIACYANTTIIAVSKGKVTKLGYPYNPSDLKKGHLRYVQITDEQGYDVRYFYVNPLCKAGDDIEVGQTIGESQGLVDVYPGITDHFHFEVKKKSKVINPHEYLDGLA